MFDIGWTEMLVIAVVMIVVVGPKDLPRMLRTFGKTTAKLRAMAGDFQKQFNDALKEAELEDVKKSVDELRNLNPANEIRKQLNPFEQAAADVRAGLNSLKPSQPVTPADPAAEVTHAAEPLKNGATAMPGVVGPEAMSPQPTVPATNGAAGGPLMTAATAAPAVVAAPAANGEADPAKAANPKSAAKAPPEKKARAAKPSPVKAAAKPAASKPRATETVAAKSSGRKSAAKKPKANPS
jgi:sec-independent protein translocase protein TatB